MTATYYVITSDSDVPFQCCMSWSQLDTLQAQGNDIGSQTIDHPNLTTLTTTQMTQEICGSRQDMINHGITDPQSFAYPFGSYNSTVEGVVQQCGFNNARQVAASRPRIPRRARRTWKPFHPGTRMPYVRSRWTDQATCSCRIWRVS